MLHIEGNDILAMLPESMHETALATCRKAIGERFARVYRAWLTGLEVSDDIVHLHLEVACMPDQEQQRWWEESCAAGYFFPLIYPASITVKVHDLRDGDMADV